MLAQPQQHSKACKGQPAENEVLVGCVGQGEL